MFIHVHTHAYIYVYIYIYTYINDNNVIAHSYDDNNIQGITSCNCLCVYIV